MIDRRICDKCPKGKVVRGQDTVCAVLCWVSSKKRWLSAVSLPPKECEHTFEHCIYSVMPIVRKASVG